MTEPITSILPLTNENSNGFELLKNFSNIIEEFRNFGTHVLLWEIESRSGGDENVPVTMLFRNILELTDAISILVKESSIDPCKLLLRGILESYFNIYYIIIDKTYDRSMSFMTWHFIQKIKYLKKFIKEEESHQLLLKELGNHKSIIENIPHDILSPLTVNIISYENLLKSDKYEKFNNEFFRLKKANNWYQAFDGPRNIKDLAAATGKLYLYEFLYRKWSNPIHGTDIIDKKLLASSHKSNIVDILQIRYVADAQDVTSHTIQLLLNIYNDLIKEKIPERQPDFEKWKSTIQKPYDIITSSKRLITIH